MNKKEKIKGEQVHLKKTLTFSPSPIPKTQKFNSETMSDKTNSTSNSSSSSSAWSNTSSPTSSSRSSLTWANPLKNRFVTRREFQLNDASTLVLDSSASSQSFNSPELPIAPKLRSPLYKTKYRKFIQANIDDPYLIQKTKTLPLLNLELSSNSNSGTRKQISPRLRRIRSQGKRSRGRKTRVPGRSAVRGPLVNRLDKQNRQLNRYIHKMFYSVINRQIGSQADPTENRLLISVNAVNVLNSIAKEIIMKFCEVADELMLITGRVRMNSWVANAALKILFSEEDGQSVLREYNRALQIIKFKQQF